MSLDQLETRLANALRESAGRGPGVDPTVLVARVSRRAARRRRQRTAAIGVLATAGMVVAGGAAVLRYAPGPAQTHTVAGSSVVSIAGDTTPSPAASRSASAEIPSSSMVTAADLPEIKLKAGKFFPRGALGAYPETTALCQDNPPIAPLDGRMSSYMEREGDVPQTYLSSMVQVFSASSKAERHMRWVHTNVRTCDNWFGRLTVIPTAADRVLVVSPKRPDGAVVVSGVVEVDRAISGFELQVLVDKTLADQEGLGDNPTDDQKMALAVKLGERLLTTAHDRLVSSGLGKE